MADLQLDTVAMQRGILTEENAKVDCKEAKRLYNDRLIQQKDTRWEIDRMGGSDTRKKPLRDYIEWVAIDRKMRSHHVFGLD